MLRDKIKLSSLLFLYLFIILAASNNVLWSDENQYVMFAKNLTHGYYASEGDIFLWNGPGYPLILAPFILLNLPWLTAKLLNALFLFMAILYFYYTLCFYMRERTAMCFSYLLGIYPPFFRYIHVLYTETLSIFLICGFLFHFCKLQRNNKYSKTHLFISSGYLAYLALTKVIFGYVICAGIVLFFSFYIWKKKDTLKKTLFVYLIAFFLCLPYLIYTYSLTNRIFYWGNSGGLSLYWMSTPVKDELGDWLAWGSRDWQTEEQLLEGHKEFFNELKKYPPIQKDDKLKEQAMQNIIHNPGKYIKNWLANIGRLVFSYPYSYAPQKLSTYFYIIPNMFVAVFCILCIYPTYLGRRYVPFEIYALLLFVLISFAGISLLSAYNRMFTPLVPVFALWIFYTLKNLLEIKVIR